MRADSFFTKEMGARLRELRYSGRRVCPYGPEGIETPVHAGQQAQASSGKPGIRGSATDAHGWTQIGAPTVGSVPTVGQSTPRVIGEWNRRPTQTDADGNRRFTTKDTKDTKNPEPGGLTTKKNLWIWLCT